MLSISYRNIYDWKEDGYKQKVYNRYNRIKAEVSKINGVEQVATGAFSFGSGSGSTSDFSIVLKWTYPKFALKSVLFF